MGSICGATDLPPRRPLRNRHVDTWGEVSLDKSSEGKTFPAPHALGSIIPYWQSIIQAEPLACLTCEPRNKI
jgi:hypothetical protein